MERRRAFLHPLFASMRLGRSRDLHPQLVLRVVLLLKVWLLLRLNLMLGDVRRRRHNTGNRAG
jgi:hypothetical protein